MSAVELPEGLVKELGLICRLRNIKEGGAQREAAKPVVLTEEVLEPHVPRDTHHRAEVPVNEGGVVGQDGVAGHEVVVKVKEGPLVPSLDLRLNPLRVAGIVVVTSVFLV